MGSNGGVCVNVRYVDGLKVYEVTANWSIIKFGKYYVRSKHDTEWQYIADADNLYGFYSIEDALQYISRKDDSVKEVHAASNSVSDDARLAMALIGAYQINSDSFRIDQNNIRASIVFDDDTITIEASTNNNKSMHYYPNSDLGMDNAIRYIESAYRSCGIDVSGEVTSTITSAINTRDLASHIGQVRSSNIWGYYYYKPDRKSREGYLLIQFKNKNGGKGDVYIYYDVPFTIYRKLETTNSKGHYFWVYIRNYYKYSKLTGNKRGVLPNAINN